MSPPLFNQVSIFDEAGIWTTRGLADLPTIAALALLPMLLLILVKRRKGRDSDTYYPDLAWLRAGSYFCLCWLISAASGVLPTLLGGVTAITGKTWAFTLIAILLFEAFAYYRIWAIGTKTLDRKHYPVAVLSFGLLWGLAEAQLFLSFFAIAERAGLGSWWAALICYFAIGAYYGPWHRFYWDFFVAPEHNIPEWNMKKVFFVHTPNIVFTLIFLVVFRDPWSFIALQCFCLVGACHTMRFPSPWDTLSKRKIVDTYL